MTEILDLIQGNTSEVKLVRPGFPGLADLLDGNWTCVQAVLDCSGATVVTAAAVTDKTLDEFGKEAFVVAVSPADSATLTVPATEPYLDYTWMIELENPTTVPPYRKEHHITLRVRTQGIP